MFETVLALAARIISNPSANFFQKKLTENESSLTINFYSSLFMALLGLPLLGVMQPVQYNSDLILLVLCAGLLCFLGTICLIKALSIGEVSVLGPINSYKSVVGLIFAFVLLGEVPNLKAIVGFLCIFFASFLFVDDKGRFLLNKSVVLRFLALFFSGIEAVILKKIILLTSPLAALFFWCLTGVIFSFSAAMAAGKIRLNNGKNLSSCLYIAILLYIMQLSTNFVFKRVDVGLSLALFQLSSIISLFIGFKFFHEKGIIKKTTGTMIMILGSALILL